MSQNGHETRGVLIDKLNFINANYDPEEVFVESDSTQVSVYSAYSFLLGLYPGQVDFINFKGSTFNHASENEQFVRATSVRALESDSEALGGRNVDIFTSQANLNLMEPRKCPNFFNKVKADTIAAGHYQNFDGLFQDMADTFNIPVENINFFTAYNYLDDY